MAVGELAGELPSADRPSPAPARAEGRRPRPRAGEGTRRVYRVDLDGVAAVRSYFDRFWDQALGDFKAEAERRERSKG